MTKQKPTNKLYSLKEISKEAEDNIDLMLKSKGLGKYKYPRNSYPETTE